MSLRLVSSGDERARTIRDHLLPLIRESGKFEMQRDAVRLTLLELPPWLFRYWTPFNELPSDEAASPGYRHAIERQRAQSAMPYGLEVWRDKKLLCVLWGDDGALAVEEFVRGPWEDEVLAL